ncbi:PREDICTED: LOW QUALITY PROTEIN: UDP-glycosyltransferase 73D1 [Camelina sativa]|uniref:Glycosyltransferase n=1 Tax=Camelina sativa TaxID=90675 RepID=A0ABM0YPN5_CAMSA|nr:PREDICTED: LOW QUALITY PROTEIN: UDP-glycosyltransferase 73D1 [Camelina sativa]
MCKHLLNPKMESKLVSKAKRLHFVLVPLMAQGHLIPMVDISKILARQGNIVTIVTTPQNASRFAKTVDRARSEADLEINVVTFPIPYKEFGLPKDCETLDTLPSKDLLRRFYDAVDKLQDPLERFLEQQDIPPSCIISDKCLSWTSKTAKRFKIPRIVFHGMCCFSLLSSHNLHLHSSHLSVSSASEPFSIPAMPHKIEITRAQLPGAFQKLENMDDVRDKMRESESEAFGVIVNSFQELEPGYAEAYAKAINKKVWFIGPVSLCNERMADLFDRGNNDNVAISETECVQFLDSMRPRSVLYVCLGSLCRLIPNPLIELGLGLEESRKPFIWVIKTEERHMNELDEWLKRENFEERVRGRGIVIKGWSPQAMILSHGSTGGFLSHCGWNSTIEAICFGVPMITWPLFAEQFLNEKLVVEVLKIGVRVGVESPVRWGDEERVGVLVKKQCVVKAVKLVMEEDCQHVDEDSEFVRRRRRIQELAVMAKKAVNEKGSSSINVSILMQDVLEQLSLE